MKREQAVAGRLCRWRVGIAVLALAGPVHAANRLAANWCAVGDPATYLAIAAHHPNAVACPTPADPQTLPKELALPMPCGQVMEFMKVVVGGDTLLDQQKLYLGEPADSGDPTETLADGPQTAELAGAFTHGRGRRNPQSPPHLRALHGRAYYVGKYPVTAAQYAAYQKGLLGGTAADGRAADPACHGDDADLANLQATQILPASRISWFDATEFGRAYNQWLMAQDRRRIAASRDPRMPWEQGSPAYVRLPTEAEWEYAARGGAVSRQDFGEQTYAVRDPQTGRVRQGQLAEIAELASADEINPAQPLFGVGRKLPNLFGLYDMLGDVDEIMFEPFRLTRPDQLQGEAGGYILKGGDVFTPASVLGVGYRREVPFFTLRGEVRSPLTGFRLVIALPVFVDGQVPGRRWTSGRQNLRQQQALQTALRQLVTTGDSGRNALTGELTALRRANQAGKLGNQRLAAQLAQIQAGLAASDARLEVEDRNVRREKLESATLLAFNIRAVGASVFANLNLVSEYRAQARAKQAHQAERLQALAKIQAAIEQKDRSLTKSFGLYLQLVLELAKASPPEVADAADAVRREFAAEGMGFFDKYREAVLAEVTEARSLDRQVPAAVQRTWLYQIDDTRARREQLYHDIP